MTSLWEASWKTLAAFREASGTVRAAALRVRVEVVDSASENVTTIVPTMFVTGEELAKTMADAARV